MRQDDLRMLVDGTRDAAYVVDSEGSIVGWNDGAVTLFGVSATKAIGRACYGIIRGADEIGTVCSQNCIIRQAIQQGKTIACFDMRVQTPDGRKWCNVSIFVTRTTNSSAPFAVHILRRADVAKRLEFAVRDYLVAHTRMSAEEGTALLASTTATFQTNLSVRELEVLRMLSSGHCTTSIAGKLHISITTVNNHIQHILHKLDSHTRLEAIRRAERGGLV